MEGSGSSRRRATRPAGGGTSRWFFGRSASASASSRSGAVERCTGAVYGAASEGWNSGLRGYSRAMRFSAVVALGLVCLGTFLGLAACGGGTSTGTQTHPAGTAAPQGEMRATQSRRAQTRRTAAATPRPRAEGRCRQGAGAAGAPPGSRRRAQAARRASSGRRGAGREPSDSRAPGAAPARLPGRQQLPLEPRPAARCSPSRRRPARGSCARTSTGGRWRRRGRRTRATRSTPPTASPTSTSCVRNAQQRGLRILLTIWGTPRLGERRRRPQPRADAGVRPRGLRPRASRRATRARTPATRTCRYYSVWNEPNLGQFLVPQFDGRGPAGGAGDLRAALPGRVRRDQEREPRRRWSRSARPRRAGATTSTHGHLADASRPAGSRSCSRGSGRACGSTPGRTTRTRRRPSLPPTQLARWPNVTLSQLPRFEAALRTWFGRSNVPVWITEYAYQTSPPASLGVSYPHQAAYLQSRADDGRVPPVGADAGLVHVPGHARERMGKRPARGRRRAETRPSQCSEPVAQTAARRNAVVRLRPSRAGVLARCGGRCMRLCLLLGRRLARQCYVPASTPGGGWSRSTRCSSRSSVTAAPRQLPFLLVPRPGLHAPRSGADEHGDEMAATRRLVAWRATSSPSELQPRALVRGQTSFPPLCSARAKQLLLDLGPLGESSSSLDAASRQ